MMRDKIDASLLNFFNTDRFLDESVIIFDFDGNIITSNRQFQFFDFFMDYSKSRNIKEIINKSQHNELNKRIAKLKKGKMIPTHEYKLIGVNLQTAHVEITSRLVNYDNKKAILSLIRDITIRKESEMNLLYTIIQTEEKERQRFARDLHDELGPFLSGLRLYLHELEAGDINEDKRKTLLQYMMQMTNEAADKLRMIAGNMTPQNMIDIGLTESVNRLISKLNMAGNINIVLQSSGNEMGIEPAFNITLYRIILELINNSIKHAQSYIIQIRLIYQKKNIKLYYKDNGIGFDLYKELSLKSGIGLRSILNRIDLYNGNIIFKNLQPQGIEYKIIFPR